MKTPDGRNIIYLFIIAFFVAFAFYTVYYLIRRNVVPSLPVLTGRYSTKPDLIWKMVESTYE